MPEDSNQPAFARSLAKPEPAEPMYNRAPPNYQGNFPQKDPTFPPFNPPLGRQPTVRQMNYGETENVYEASPAYKSPVYQQSPAQNGPDVKPYGYNAVEDRKNTPGQVRTTSTLKTEQKNAFLISKFNFFILKIGKLTYFSHISAIFTSL